MRWGDACRRDPVCVVALDAAKSATAYFGLADLTVEVRRPGSVRTSVIDGQTGTVGWDGACSGTTEPTCTLTLTEDAIAIADFVLELPEFPTG